VGGDREAVLLYGAAARFARDAARVGSLRYAEVAAVAGGEVDVVATVQGTYAFARSSPAFNARASEATHCDDLEEDRDAFVRLPPPLAGLWLDQVREFGWAWPEGGPEDFAFIDYDGGAEIARASCDSDAACLIDGPAGRRDSEGLVTVSLAEFTPYMP